MYRIMHTVLSQNLANFNLVRIFNVTRLPILRSKSYFSQGFVQALYGIIEI